MKVIVTPWTQREISNKTIREAIEYLVSYPTCLFLDIDILGRLKDINLEDELLNERLINGRYFWHCGNFPTELTGLCRNLCAEGLIKIGKVKMSQWERKIKEINQFEYHD
jgi:hypothetical protein